jgi:hypothetical protein
MWVECANQRMTHFRDAECGGKWEEQEREDELTGEKSTVRVCVDVGKSIVFSANHRASVPDPLAKKVIAKFPETFRRVKGPGPKSGRIPLADYLKQEGAALLEPVATAATEEG